MRVIYNFTKWPYSFVISCLREFLLFSKAVNVNPGLFRTNQTWFDINGGTIRRTLMEVREHDITYTYQLMKCTMHAGSWGNTKKLGYDDGHFSYRRTSGEVLGEMGGGGGVRDVIIKDLKSSHQTGKTFHKSYKNDIQYPLFFIFVLALARPQCKPFFFLKSLDDVINCDVINCDVIT